MIMAQLIWAMHERDAVPGTLVEFTWSDRSQKAQIDEDVKGRARILARSVAEIMDRPHVSLVPNRICIQAIDDANVTLGVKLKYLKKVNPIEIHVFHAQSDNSTSNGYLKKEMEIANNTNYDMVLTVHPSTMSLLPHRVHIGNRMVTEFMKKDCFFLNDLNWLVPQPLATNLDLDDIVNRVKDCVKSLFSRCIQRQYKIAGDSTEFTGSVVAMSCLQKLGTILSIQLKGIEQGHTHMNWLPNHKVDMKLLSQIMMYIHLSIDAELRNVHRIIFQRHYNVVVMHGEGFENVCQFLREFNEERSSIEDADFKKWTARLARFENDTAPILSNFETRMFLQKMHDLFDYFGEKVDKLRRTERHLRLALVLGGLDSHFSGQAIAITIPGDFEGDKEQMKESLLYMIIQLTGHPSTMEIHDI